MLKTIAAKQVRHDTDFEFWMLVVNISRSAGPLVALVWVINVQSFPRQRCLHQPLTLTMCWALESPRSLVTVQRTVCVVPAHSADTAMSAVSANMLVTTPSTDVHTYDVGAGNAVAEHVMTLPTL